MIWHPKKFNRYGGDVVADERKNKGIFVPTWAANVGFSAVVILCGWIWQGSQYAGKVQAQEAINKDLTDRMSITEDLAKGHEKILPILQNRLEKMDDKLDRLLSMRKTEGV